MDAYPEDYVNHNLPLVLLSGLEVNAEDEAGSSLDYPLLAEKGPRIFSDFPPLSGAVAEELRSVLLDEDGSQMPWRTAYSSNDSPSAPQIGYKIKSIGRVSPCRTQMSIHPRRDTNGHCSPTTFRRAKQIPRKARPLQALLPIQITAFHHPLQSQISIRQSRPLRPARPPSPMAYLLRYG